MNLPKPDVPKEIWVDCDATSMTNDFPFIGEELDHCVPTLKKLIKAGHNLILVTMRVDHLLDEAVAWFRARDIEFFAINRNPNYETGSRKIYCGLILDDKSLGMPLIYDPTYHRKPFVDWEKVDQMLEERGYYIKQNVGKESVQS